MPTAKEKVKAASQQSQEQKVWTNVRNGKIVYREGTSAGIILDLYRKVGNNKEKIEAGLNKAIKSGKTKSNNVNYRVNRIVDEIVAREKAGFSV